jgi:hypothetical protein
MIHKPTLSLPFSPRINSAPKAHVEARCPASVLTKLSAHCPGRIAALLRKVALLSVLAGLFCITQAPAQTSSTGALTVMAKDPTGALVVGATVTITNSSALSRTGTTGPDGSYTFGLLPPGDYAVKLSASGFEALEAPSVTVTVSETSRIHPPCTQPAGAAIGRKANPLRNRIFRQASSPLFGISRSRLADRLKIPA